MNKNNVLSNDHLKKGNNQKKLPPIIDIYNLSKSYGSTKVFEKLNLKINYGDRVALLGVNGSGKTTLIEIILGLRTKDKGKIIYTGGFRNFLKNTQIVFQVGQYPKRMKVYHLVKFYLKFYSRACSLEDALRLIELLELKLFWKKRINTLSFGQHKKLEAALMFMVDSDFCIVDEVTAGVDINARFRILKLFQKMLDKNFNKGMIWITHDSSEIEKLCNRVVILSKKTMNVTFDGSLADVKKKYHTIEEMVVNHLREEVDRGLDVDC